MRTQPKSVADMRRYMHFQVAPSSTTQPHALPEGYPAPLPNPVLSRLWAEPPDAASRTVGVAQWVNCDIRTFDYSVLGQ